ncbi:hypothetical protein NKG05_14750 [Oerskovia sp. M15]
MDGIVEIVDGIRYREYGASGSASRSASSRCSSASCSWPGRTRPSPSFST